MKVQFTFSPQEKARFCKRQLFANNQVTKSSDGVEFTEKTEVTRGDIASMQR